MSIRSIVLLLKLFYSLEKKNKNTVSVVFLYLCNNIILLYNTINKIEDITLWNALYWIILIFTVFQSVSISKNQIKNNERIFFANYVKPNEYLISKILFEWILGFLISLGSYIMFILLLGNVVTSLNIMFLGTVFIGLFGIIMLMVFTNELGKSIKINQTITFIITLPLLLPIILICVKTTQLILLNQSIGSWIVSLVILNIIYFVLISIFFPLAWKD